MPTRIIRPREKKSQQKPVQLTIAQLRKKLLGDHKRLGNWRAVAVEWQIPPGTLCRIAETDYEPKDPHKRVLLRLPALESAPVCIRCGVVHLRKTCPRLRVYHGLFDMPIRVLKWKLEHREEYKAPV
jgi:hypothetical protein